MAKGSSLHRKKYVKKTKERILDYQKGSKNTVSKKYEQTH